MLRISPPFCNLKSKIESVEGLTFKLEHTDGTSHARAGCITTGHGVIETPIFMPVGTAGSVKAVHLHELKDDIKAQIILGNTYHLYLRPGLCASFTKFVHNAAKLVIFNYLRVRISAEKNDCKTENSICL